MTILAMNDVLDREPALRACRLAVDELTVSLTNLSHAWEKLPPALRADIDSGYAEAVDDMLERLSHRLASEAATRRHAVKKHRGKK